MTEREKEQKLKERIKADYETYIQQLEAKSAQDLIRMASEIADTQFVYDELMVEGAFLDFADYLLEFDHPLGQAVHCWQEDQDFDHHEGLEHALWMDKENAIGRGMYMEPVKEPEPSVFGQEVTMC